MVSELTEREGLQECWQCPDLAHLNLSENEMGEEGAGTLAGVLLQCRTLAHLDLSRNAIGGGGVGKLAGVLAQCKALAHLDLRNNAIGALKSEKVRASWRKATGLLL